MLLSTLATGATASWDANLNYRSPSFDHDHLGIDMSKVQTRSLEKRDYTEWKTEDLSFTHGVASVSVCYIQFIKTNYSRETHSPTLLSSGHVLLLPWNMTGPT